jgi:hypothetical protein
MNATNESRFTTSASTLLQSPLEGVSAEAWHKLMRKMSVQAIGDISESGGFGSFDLRARRLGELGVMANLRTERRGDRQIWVGDFVAPYTEAEFLRSLVVQTKVFKVSMKGYDLEMKAGTIVRPEGVSRSGALAILHRGGKGALASWPSRALSDTIALHEAAKDIF